MPRAKSQPVMTSTSGPATSAPPSTPFPATGSFGEVLTQAEAAAYLRVDEQTLLQMVGREDFPGRRVGTEWRFLKSALQDWLRTPLRQKRGILAHIGAFKDDPTLEEMVKEIYERRRRPMTEED